MKNSVRPLLLVTAFVAAMTGCSSDNQPGGTNVEEGSAKTLIPKEHAPAPSKDSVVASLHREANPLPTGEQRYDSAHKTADRNRDGKADK